MGEAKNGPDRRLQRSKNIYPVWFIARSDRYEHTNIAFSSRADRADQAVGNFEQTLKK